MYQANNTHWKDYNDICSRVRPNVNLDFPLFKTVDGGVIDIQKATSRIYYDILVSERFWNNPQLYGNELRR